MVEKVIFRTLIFFGSIIIIYIGFLYFSYLNEIIRLGEGYDFKIGISKKEAYKIVVKEYGEDIVKYRIFNGRKFIDEQPFVLSEMNLDKIIKYPDWRFYFQENASNYIHLEFERGYLSAIYRHRQYFELP